MKKYILTLLVGIVLVACTAVQNTISKIGSRQAVIANTQWVLADNVSGKKPTMALEVGKVTGNAGCNNYFGELILDASNGTFIARNIGSTKMACDNLNEENNFFQMLEAANKYVINGNVLELYKDHLLLMKFNKTN